MTSGRSVLRPSWASPLLAAAGLWLVTGCTTDSATEVSVTHPTMIEISPDSLLGAVPCSEGSGLQRYVATLTDVTVATADQDEPVTSDPGVVEYDGQFTLPSSPPTPCLSGVGFGYVVPGRRYQAKVEGYDTSVLSPRAPGSSEMVDVVPELQSPRDLDDERRQLAAGNIVEPRWNATCSVTTAVYLTVVQAVCSPFDAELEGKTELRLSVPQLLGDLECGEAVDQVARLSVLVEVAGEEDRLLDVACDAGDEIVIGDLPGKASVKAFVSAFSADDVEPVAGATCRGVTFQSSSVTATCGALSAQGTLRVDLQAALQAAGLSCTESSVSDVQVLPQGETKTRSFPPPDCLQPFDATFAGRTGYVTVTAFDGDKSELGSVACHGDLVPGDRVLAECEPIPAP